MTRRQLSKADVAAEIAALRRLAISEDWSTRESGGFGLRDLIEMSFDEAMRLTQSWPSDSSYYVRRAACLGCMQRKAFTNERRLLRVLERLWTIMHDDDVYVRNCCGPFVVGYLGYTYPAITLPWLREMADSADLNVRANVAKAFSQALGRRHPHEGLEILNCLADDDRHRVASATGASVRNIARAYSGGLSSIADAFPRLAGRAAR